MIRSSKLPLLPGYSFEREVGQTRFHKSTQFEYLRGIVPYLSEADRPGFGGYPFSWKTPDTTPSLYPRRESKDLPGWLIFDKQILTFEAYFQEAVWEVENCPYRIRKVKIYYYPEDGTVQVIEPKVENSGMPQGVLIARQRIRFPKPMDHAFYDTIDFNIGKNVELFGRVFRIVNCDKFTRNFLNRMGIFVGDPLNYPVDPHSDQEEKKKSLSLGKKPRRSAPVLGKYLEFDKKILRFYGYWDDRSSQYGYVHKLEIQYFLADDTVEIHENIPPNSGIDRGSTFLKRGKLPKVFAGLPGPGDEEPYSFLNILPTGFLKGKSVVDPLGAARVSTGYYRDNDLAIGAVLNVYGRKVVLVDCDGFTKEYYRTKYGIDSFERLPVPSDDLTRDEKQKEFSQGNGKDLEGNSKKVLEAPKKNMYKFLTKGRMGIDSHVLRFKAKMISADPVNDDRTFVISYYLSDDEISVYERALRNSGSEATLRFYFDHQGLCLPFKKMSQLEPARKPIHFVDFELERQALEAFALIAGFASKFMISKREIFKPDQEKVVSVKPQTFQKEDFWVGNELKLEGFRFRLISADEYCLRYMELHNQEFPKSNISSILNKIREKLGPIYKNFVNCYLIPFVENYEGTGVLSFCDLRSALFELLGNDITEHEIITVARQFRLKDRSKKFSKCEIINICRKESERCIWSDFDRFRKNLQYKDPCCTGFVPQQVAVSLCKGARVPIEPDLLDTVIEMVDRNECGEVSIHDLLNFFDTEGKLPKPMEPISVRREFSEFKRLAESNDFSWIDFDCLLEAIGLEETLIKEGHAEETKNSELTSNQAATLPN